MGEQPNPYDVVVETAKMVEELNRALYGDPINRTPGLFDKLDKLSADIDRMQRKRPNITNWVLGYFTFCFSGFFAILTVVNWVSTVTHVGYLPIEVSGGAAVALALVALLFFLTGFGWIGGE